MSNKSLIIEERSRDIGDFLVGRLLPFRKKRMVGPFIFIDHMGPSEMGNGKYLDIGPHPHIGLSTLTYLFEGEMMHRDSLGTVQRIRPGAVNWMTGGKGIVHSERTPDDMRNSVFNVHGYQIWVALPQNLEKSEPSFFHAAADDLPSWKEGGIDYTLVAGEAYGNKSPVPVHSPLFMLDLKCESDAEWSPESLFGEVGICIVKGSVTACGDHVEAGNLLIAKPGMDCGIKIAAGSHILIFGGEPFEEKRFIFWNFVSSNEEQIEEAKKDWAEDRFPKIEGESGRIPLPGM